jgi:hypothetical protein
VCGKKGFVTSFSFFFVEKKKKGIFGLFSDSLPESSPAAPAGPAARTLIAQRLYFSTGTAKDLPSRPFQ